MQSSALLISETTHRRVNVNKKGIKFDSLNRRSNSRVLARKRLPVARRHEGRDEEDESHRGGGHLPLDRRSFTEGEGHKCPKGIVVRRTES